MKVIGFKTVSFQAVMIGLNPLYLMIPVASVCGYVFLLPVGSPPNALSYTTAEMEPLEMVSKNCPFLKNRSSKMRPKIGRKKSKGR